MRYACFLVSCVCFFSPCVASAQVSTSGLLSSEALAANGLERMWITQLEVNSAQGRIVGLSQHVSPTIGYIVLEFEHKGRWYSFSERSLNAFGEPVGVEGATKLAAEAIAQIKLEAKLAQQPLAKDPEVVTRFVPQIRLAAASDRGSLQLIDGETGKSLWTTVVGKASLPTTEPALNDNVVAVCNGSTLHVFSAATGQPAWQRRVSGAIGAGPAMTDEMVFIPMMNGIVEGFRLDRPNATATTLRSFGRTLVQPAVSFNSVAWPTESGNLYVGSATTGKARFRIQANGSIDSTPTFMAPDRIIATSLDGQIYCIDEANGAVLWRFSTGETISQSALVVDENVYAVTDSHELYCIDGRSSLERWVTTGVDRLVAGNKNRIYCIDILGHVLILEANTGARLGSMDGLGLNLQFINFETDRIIVGNRRGLVQCLRERAQRWPVVQGQQAQAPMGAAPAEVAPAAEGAAPAEAAPASDPFATPGEAPATDPFGAETPAAEAPAEEAPAMPAADPFR